MNKQKVKNFLIEWCSVVGPDSNGDATQQESWNELFEEIYNKHFINIPRDSSMTTLTNIELINGIEIMFLDPKDVKIDLEEHKKRVDLFCKKMDKASKISNKLWQFRFR
jgi:hypothetical protein